MTKDQSPLLPVEIAEQLGRAMILGEHAHFENQAVDNDAHVPRLRRIVDTIGFQLVDWGIPQQTAKSVVKRLKDYAKDLFMKAWMRDLQPHENREAICAEGSQCYDSLYRSAKREKPVV